MSSVSTGHTGDQLAGQVGAGIVADSDPVKEYEETFHKAAGIRLAIEKWQGAQLKSMKTPPKFRWLLVFLVPLIVLFLGIRICKSPPDETWYCYDTSGRPVGGVIFLYSYGLPSHAQTGVYFRFADASGKVVLDLTKDDPGRGLNRAHVCIYSRQLKNGDVNLGVRWHEGQPIPKGPVYFDEWNNKIYIAPNDDPQVWHAALDQLMTCSSQMENPVGGQKLVGELYTFIALEREDFLQKFGETTVAPEYLNDIRFKLYHKNLAALPRDNLKFKNITPELPKP